MLQFDANLKKFSLFYNQIIFNSDGLALKGVYSYSDGFYKRTVHYVADENGYRVIKYVIIGLQ